MKKFVDPVDGDTSKSENNRINDIIRGARGTQTTITDKPKSDGMNTFLRVSAGRGVAMSPKMAAVLAKSDEFTQNKDDLSTANPKLIKILEAMTDEELKAMATEAKEAIPQGDAGAGTGGQYPRSTQSDVSAIIRHIVRERKRKERGGK